LSSRTFDVAYKLLKSIFKEKFMRNPRLSAVDPDSLHHKGPKKWKGDVRGAFKSWCRELLGDHAFLLAVLRHGLFDVSDLKKYAELLTSERKQDHGDT